MCPGYAHVPGLLLTGVRARGVQIDSQQCQLLWGKTITIRHALRKPRCHNVQLAQFALGTPQINSSTMPAIVGQDNHHTTHSVQTSVPQRPVGSICTRHAPDQRGSETRRVAALRVGGYNAIVCATGLGALQPHLRTQCGACRDPGSNRGPSDLQSDALPTELSRPLPTTSSANSARTRRSRLTTSKPCNTTGQAPNAKAIGACEKRQRVTAAPAHDPSRTKLARATREACAAMPSPKHTHAPTCSLR